MSSPDEILEGLIGSDGRLVVFDCETTGVYSSDRVVELAMVTLSPTGDIIDCWESLINPGRDVGPTWLHGITGDQVSGAPDFGDVAGAVAMRLDGAVLVAHNLPFDVRMIAGEFNRTAVPFDAGAGIDTLALTRGKLADVCRTYGIEIGTAHRALDDALATARLLLRVVGSIQAPLVPARVSAGLPVSGRTVVRDSADFASRATVVVSRVIEAGERIVHSPDESLGGLGYLDLLERSLENLQIDASESQELESLAETLGLGDAQRKQVHVRYLEQLIDEVVSDGEVTSDEYEMLVRVAASLGMDQDLVHRRTRPWRRGEAQFELEPGMRLCLTGDAVGISREELGMRLRRAGFVVDPNVTKATQLLVAADPSSQSGKAQSALKYGVPIVAVDQMISARPGETVPVAVLTVERLVAHVCTACGVTWTSPSRSPYRGRLCAACRGESSSASRASAKESSESPDGQESLTCSQCGSVWSRVRARGRKPKVCPQCRPAS